MQQWDGEHCQVAISARTLIGACGAGFRPYSMNPKIPIVRDAANPPSAPKASPAAASRSTAVVVSNSSRATSRAPLAWSRNAGPTPEMVR